VFEFESQLQCDTVNINAEFARLVSSTRNSFERNGIGCKELATALTCHEAQLPEEVGKAHSISEIFFHVNRSWSWFNYHLLEEIINDFGDQSDHERLANYKQKFTEYSKKRVFEVPSAAFHGTSADSDDQVNLVVKVDHVWENYYVKDAATFCNNLASVLGVKRHLLRLVSVRNGCVLLTFLIPRSVAQPAFLLSSCQKTNLGDIGVMELRCDGYDCSDFEEVEMYHAA